jgi:serpin B
MRLSRLWYLVLILLLVLVLLGGMYVYTQDQAFAVHFANDSHAFDRSLSPGSEGDPVFVKDMIEANNRFAFDLYANLSRSPDNTGRNLFFSPYSISSAFAITYEGARGTTADAIRSVFYFPKNDAGRRRGYANISRDLDQPDARSALRTVNGLWTDRSYPLAPAYTRIAEENYGAMVRSLDLGRQPEESRLVINREVAVATENRIKNILPEGSVHPDTAFVITSAIYFKGAWESPFSRAATKEQNFTVSPTKMIRVPMMQYTYHEAELRYRETTLFQALELPYKNSGGKRLSMLVILPKNNNLTAVEGALDPEQIPLIRGSLKLHAVKVSFPKFLLEETYQLPNTLSEMGMPAAFKGGPISPAWPGEISSGRGSLLIRHFTRESSM